MCVSAGAPKKPEYGPCGERHGGFGNIPTNISISYYGYNGDDDSTSSVSWPNWAITTDATANYITLS